MRDFLHKDTSLPTDEALPRTPRRETLQFLRAFARFYEPMTGPFSTLGKNGPGTQAALC